MKNNFVEISKVYNFVDTISSQNIFMSNITYYKNVTPKTSTYVVDKFENYFKLEKKSRQSYTNKRNIEGYQIKILVSDMLLLQENRIKLRKYINKCIEFITGYPKVERLKYVVSKYTSVGGSKYLNIFFIDRVIYEKPLEINITKKIWVNKNTGKRVSKTYKNAIQEKRKIIEVKYFSSKIRFKLIHQKNQKQFINMMNTIKSLLKQYEINVFNTEHVYWFEKKYLKKRINKNGNYFYVNDYDNQFRGVFKEFEYRAIRIYNTFVNAFQMACIDVTQVNFEQIRHEINDLSVRYTKDIAMYESSILAMIDLVTSGDIYDVYSKNKKS